MRQFRLRSSDEEVPVVQLCCLPLAEVQTIDIDTTEDIRILLEVLATGDEARKTAAVSQIAEVFSHWLKAHVIQAFDEAGGLNILHRAMKHEYELIRAKSTFIVARFLETGRMRDPGCIETLVELINTDESWEIKKYAIEALGNTAYKSKYASRVRKAGAIAAILSHLRVDSTEYMETAYKALYSMTLPMTHASDHHYLGEVAPFLLSRFSSLSDITAKGGYFLYIFANIVKYSPKDIELSENICVTLIKLMYTANPNILESLIEAVTNIMQTTSEFTELFIEYGLLTKLKELLKCHHFNIACSVIPCLNAMTLQTTDIVDKVIRSGIIYQVICLIGSDDVNDADISKVLGNICNNCSSSLFPQLLEIHTAEYLVKELVHYQTFTIKECIGGLRGIIRYCKEVSNPELFKQYVNAEELAERCRELVREYQKPATY